jgi:hypothetical protein
MRAILALAVLVLVGCEAAGGGDGPLAFGIVSGNGQTAAAGDDRLIDPVVGKLVREPSGGITFRLVAPAYAQGTVVNGSPVPGAVVCAVSITEGGMEPWVPCTNTDSAGTATFFFTPGTKADTARAEIRGTVQGEPAVFDTATAVVEPGSATRHRYSMGFSTGFRGTEHAVEIPNDYLLDEYGNSAYFRLRHVEGAFIVLGDTTGTAAARTVVVSDTLDSANSSHWHYLGWAAVEANDSTFSYLRVAFDSSGLVALPCETQQDHC